MSNEIQKSTKQGGMQKSTGQKLDLASLNVQTLSQCLGGMSIPRLFYQLVVFVLDGSGSMKLRGESIKSKGEEVENTVKKVIERLQNSKNNKSFDISVWAYAEECQEVLPLISTTDINLAISLNPCSYITQNRRTELKETLVNVRDLCNEYLLKYHSKNTQALVLILSDGAIHDQDDAMELCKEIKNNNKITISTILFESKDWKEKYEDEDLKFLQDNLKMLSSGSDFFASTLDPEEVRKHMIKSISTVSKID
jgi:uncharacterized protein YegL